MSVLDLDLKAREHLDAARGSSSGRSSHLVLGGRETRMTQTVIALTAGTSLAEHENPGEASVLVLEGQVRLDSAEGSWEGARCPAGGAAVPAQPARDDGRRGAAHRGQAGLSTPLRRAAPARTAR